MLRGTGSAAGRQEVLPVELGDDLAYGLGGAGGGGDDVLAGAAPVAPHLAGRPVHRLLGGGGGVHRALEAGPTAGAGSVIVEGWGCRGGRGVWVV